MKTAVHLEIWKIIVGISQCKESWETLIFACVIYAGVDFSEVVQMLFRRPYEMRFEIEVNRFRLFLFFSLTNFLVMNQNSVISDLCPETSTNFALILAAPRGQCWRLQVVFFYRQTAYRFPLAHFICAVPSSAETTNCTALCKEPNTQLMMMMMIQNSNNCNSNNTK